MTALLPDPDRPAEIRSSSALRSRPHPDRVGPRMRANEVAEGGVFLTGTRIFTKSPLFVALFSYSFSVLRADAPSLESLPDVLWEGAG